MIPSLDELAACFDAAVAESGTVEHELEVAGRRVRLRFAGPGLVPSILPALGHLTAVASPASSPDLDLRVWDSASTGSPALDVPAAPTGTETGPRYHAEADGSVLDSVDSTLSVLDAEHGVGFHYVPAATSYRWYHRGAPLKELLHAWARATGLHFVHAAAVGEDGCGVLVTGTSGRGKSTTSLACVQGGLEYAGDDYALADPDGRLIHSLYCSARLGWETVERFPGLLRPTNTPPDDKALGFIGSTQPGAVVSSFELAAVLVPEVTPGRTASVEEVSPAQALLALAPSTVLQLPGGHETGLRAARRLLEHVPTYSLRVGEDLDSIAPTIRTVLARHAAQSNA